ncbi:hypothetical protein, partial [Corynebacterium dentalis]|uniref:hypothetical protein n=1 Tax=Corynebacterium dentalis TaxID=2014528 RepID=UPI00289A3DC5
PLRPAAGQDQRTLNREEPVKHDYISGLASQAGNRTVFRGLMMSNFNLPSAADGADESGS